MAKTKRKLSAYNLHVKREMKKGKSMKAAARSWRGKGKTKSRAKPKAKSKRSRPRAKTGGRKVAKGGFNSQKVMKLIRLAALAAPAVSVAVGPGTPADKVKAGLATYTGFDPWSGTFKPELLAKGWMPYLAAIAVTYGIPKIAGIIRGI